ncbi:MAG: 4-phosphoerythronate dehydrogenase [Bacteroidales bacterium]
MLKIVADSYIPFLKGALDRVAQVRYIQGSEIKREHLVDTDALIIRTRTKCNKALLNNTPIKFIASATIGFDHIDTEYCHQNGIKWTNAPGCNSGSVKQYVASAIAEIISREKWQFHNITLGIIGAGNVGKKVENMCKTLGIKTLINDPPRERVEGKGSFTNINELILRSDIITMHVPLINQGIDKTCHLADSTFFSRMKKGSWFINTARGEVADSFALTKSLKNKHIRGAVIDVWENEPEINRELLAASNIATPHIAGYSADGKANGTAMSVRAISKFFNLGLDSWFPPNIPSATNNHFQVNCIGKSLEGIYKEISLFAYNIKQDSDTLKKSPETFEKQRENYPVRREPEHISVELNSCSNSILSIIKNLDYLII